MNPEINMKMTGIELTILEKKENTNRSKWRGPKMKTTYEYKARDIDNNIYMMFEWPENLQVNEKIKMTKGYINNKRSYANGTIEWGIHTGRGSRMRRMSSVEFYTRVDQIQKKNIKSGFYKEKGSFEQENME